MVSPVHGQTPRLSVGADHCSGSGDRRVPAAARLCPVPQVDGVRQGWAVPRKQDCSIWDVEAITRELPGLLTRNKVRFVLPDRYLAFFSHQGYQMVWFPLPAVSENPLCWAYCEGQTPEPEQVGAFTDWLRTWATDSATVIAHVRSDRQ